MLEVLIGMFAPVVVFGAFALLSVWLGAESRPWFDERPVRDERPNWFPISRGLQRVGHDVAGLLGAGDERASVGAPGERPGERLADGAIGDDVGLDALRPQCV